MDWIDEIVYRVIFEQRQWHAIYKVQILLRYIVRLFHQRRILYITWIENLNYTFWLTFRKLFCSKSVCESLIIYCSWWRYKIKYYLRDQSSGGGGGGVVVPNRKELGLFWVSKRLGKWKTNQLKGWVIEIYCHFQSMTRSNIEDWKVTSTVICKSIRVTILIIFRFVRRQTVSPKKVHVLFAQVHVLFAVWQLLVQFSKVSCCLTWNFRKLHKQLSNSCHRSESKTTPNYLYDVFTFRHNNS